MKFLLYNGRHGEKVLTEYSEKAWDYLLSQMEIADGCSLDEARAEGFWVDGGTFEQGYVSVDDGGSIETIKLTEVV